MTVKVRSAQVAKCIKEGCLPCLPGGRFGSRMVAVTSICISRSLVASEKVLYIAVLTSALYLADN